MRAAERPAEALELVLLHAELVELEANAVLVEDPQHDRLAVDARDRDHADVDVAALDRQSDAAVLGHPALGDVEVAHDLDPRDDAGDHPLRHGRLVGQHAVDAHPDAQLAPGTPRSSGCGLEMDVRCAPLGRLGDDRVHELDDRRVLGRLAQIDDLDRSRVLLALVDGLLDRVLEAVHAGDQRR